MTGTETALLAAAAAPGISEIRHAACEPHVVELCEFLSRDGRRHHGAGTHTIRVEGGTRLGGATKALYGDYIEAGSWAVVGAITGGEIEIRGRAGHRHGSRHGRAAQAVGRRCGTDDDVLRVRAVAR